MKFFVFALLIHFFAFGLTACQIHKPVAVDHVETVSKSSGQERTRPMRETVAHKPAPSQEQTAWTPIDIEPLAHRPPLLEGPSPQGEYPFRPHPKASAQPPMRPQPGTSATARRSPGQSAPVIYGAQLDQYDWDQPAKAGGAGVYRVKKGDTFFSIARKHGLTVQSLSKLNGIGAPYNIYPNQKLKVSKNAGLSASQPAPKKPTPAKGKPVAIIDTGTSAGLTWDWPAKGKLISQFSSGKSKGIDIAGQPGDPVVATSDGMVIYAGNEVTGYGELVIIEHGDGYLSTYAHNRKLLVSADQRVKKGEKIAEMGSTDSDVTKLHFEIRKNEKPIDPLKLLP